MATRFQQYGSMIKILADGWDSFLEVFKKAFQVIDDKSALRGWTPWALVWALLILMGVSFGMLWLGDKINDSGMALTRFMARAQAPLTAQFAYPAKARDRITVVMYDPQFLQSSASAWPISYQDHADALLRLASDPKARPKAILLDITFGQERDDPTITALNQALCTLRYKYKVPVFLAAMSSPDNGRLTVRAGLGANLSGSEPTCFTLVGVDYLPDSLDGLAWSYPLSRHLTDSGWQPGPADQSAQQPSYRSAAMTIAQDVAHLDLGEETAPMALVWGHNSAPQADRPERLQHCRPGQPELWTLIPGVLRRLWEDASSAPLCPYHRTLSMAQLGELPEDKLAPYLAGRYVLVGANVPGYNDFAESPVHGKLPGVYMHAMALDNLLTYEGNYKLSAEWTLPPAWPLLAPGLLAVSAVFAVHLFWSWFLGQKRFHLHERYQWTREIVRKLTDPCPIKRTQRVAQLVATGLAWLLRLSLQTVAAMGLIAFLQGWFRIGMLPVVELVSMTLLAEGLGYMKKMKWTLFGPPASNPLRSDEPCKHSAACAAALKEKRHEP
ncbi:CHASE2 domain-containing protein [Polaromonas sp. SM01]|uniref:CHASE2 domain-containing protein n=1 Tax=Polaromonas sp. SM01 TaxID=3085630 RepID=UPI002981EDDA|nr:CHASE2 domain-containing protein [Polaromonas sp. SM01]MDW5441172.1 CHASE2 domain-containing protein [Polaromonas sp. SM01]